MYKVVMLCGTCQNIFRQSDYSDIQRPETNKYNDTGLGKGWNEDDPTSKLPVLNKTSRKSRLTPDRIYVWCLGDDERIDCEERVTPKRVWCGGCHVTPPKCCFC
jgi:hypothetical protein